MIDIKNKKIGLVLSGGGAKGAYQVGMLRAMEELGIAQNIAAISGCSIGAYAAAIYSTHNKEEYRKFLFDYMKLLHEGDELPDEAIDEAKKAVASGKVSLEEFVSERRYWKFSADGIHRYVDALVADGAIERSGKRINVCGYSLEEEKPVYFDLAELSDEEKSAAIIGSGSLMYLFRPSPVRGHHLVDGGLIPDICRNPAPADKIPLKPIIGEDVDLILVNFLIAIDSVDRSLVPEGTDYLELRPSSPLEAYPGAGTLDFSPEKLRSHEALGYNDTMKFLKENCIL